MREIRMSFWKKGIAMTLALVILCICNTSVMAQTQDECMEASETGTCWECGNYGTYTAVEYGDWSVFEKVECVHGTALSDITELRDVYTVTRCSYCNYLFTKQYLKTESRTYCSNS